MYSKTELGKWVCSQRSARVTKAKNLTEKRNELLDKKRATTESLIRIGVIVFCLLSHLMHHKLETIILNFRNIVIE